MSVDHPLSEQVDQQQRCVAFRAVTAQAHGTAIEIAVRAATLTDATFAATRALVQRECLHRATSLEFLTQALQVWRTNLVSQAEGLLLMGAGAIAGAR